MSGISSVGYPSGELKHGALALINENTISYATILEKRNLQKTINNIRDIMARSGKVVVITPFDIDKNIEVIKLPQEIESLSCISAAIVMQIIAKLTADEMNLNPDKPKNLAKSVTCV